MDLHFVHYMMFLRSYRDPCELNFLKYKHKNRNLIHLMAINGHKYLLVEILKFFRSFDLNQEDEDGSTALLLSIKHKRMEMIKFLLQ